MATALLGLPRMNLRVISYNVLSSHLASASHYPTLNPDHVKAENRLPVVLDKIATEIDRFPTTVVCLQEVSYEWAGALHTFFAQKGFHLVTGLYGRKFNGYMGVCLAWPTGALDSVDVDICRLADTREDGWPRAAETPSGFFTDLVQRVSTLWDGTLQTLGLAGSRNGDDDTPPDHWSLSERRFNVLLTATLREKATGRTFCIANYHMPCAYYCPMAMTLHADLCARRLQSIAQTQGNVPCILAGDFNIKPHEPVYHYITTGELEETSPFYPSPKNGTSWKPTMKPMQSAYAVKNGQEPDFTNYALAERDTEPFIDTLDFIFLSAEWKVTDVMDLPHREASNGPFPNLDVKEPSDHIMIAASLEVNEVGQQHTVKE